MRVDRYPVFYEVYTETFYQSAFGRTYTSEEVVKRGLTEDAAKKAVMDLNNIKPIGVNQYNGYRRMA